MGSRPFRIAQEAATNALRHAQPAHVVIRLASASGRITLEVEDDGDGVKADPADAADIGDSRNLGMGLRIMES